MAEHKKRIIVEGVDFQQLFLFPRLLRAMTLAMQPGRLIIGVLMITALITLGHVWDSVTTHTVSPRGLNQGVWNENDNRAYQQTLRATLQDYRLASDAAVGGLGTPGNADLDPVDSLRRLREEYQTRRAAATSDDMRLDIDRSYTSAVNAINAAAPRGVYDATAEHFTLRFRSLAEGLINLELGTVIDSLGSMLIETPVMLWRDHRAFVIIYGALLMFVFAIGGGAISRMTAHQINRHGDQRMGVREALDFSVVRWWSLFSAQILPLILAGLVCLIIMVVGVLMAAPILDVIGALLYAFSLLLGLVLAFLLIGYIVGHPMLVPAIACENCSGPDAMQRAYAYVMTRPLHALWYWVISVIGFGLGFAIVSLFAGLTLNLTASLYTSLVSSPALSPGEAFTFFNVVRHVPEVPQPTWHDTWAATILRFWETVVICLVAAYVLAYFFTASTIGYVLMRKVADGQDIDEIWEPSATQSAPPV